MTLRTWSACATAAVVLLAGCTPLKDKCTDDSQCTGANQFCDPVARVCVANPVDNSCSPACAQWEACSNKVCLARYSGIGITQPATGAVFDGGTAVQVQAQLLLAGGATAGAEPGALPYDLINLAGGPVTTGTLTGTGLSYAGSLGPLAEGSYQVLVSWPDAGIGTSRSFQVDATGPSFFVEYTLPVRNNTATRTETDTTPAFRRDELATLNVSSNDPDVNWSSVTWRVDGIGGGTPLTGGVADGGTCSSGLFCGHFDVDLSKPTMNAFRGVMPVRVTGSDLAGNAAFADAGIAVTRWFWSLDTMSGSIQRTPALTDAGELIAVSGGRVLGVSQNGSVDWAADAGTVKAGPVVLDTDDETKSVFVAVDAAGDAFFERFGLDGSGQSYSSTGLVPTALAASSMASGSLQVGASNSQTLFSALFAGANGQVKTIRPNDATNPSLARAALPNPVTASVPSTTSASGARYTYLAQSGKLVTVWLDGQSATVEPAGGVLTAVVGATSTVIASGDNLIVGTDVGVSRFPDAGAAADWTFPATGTAPVSALSLTSKATMVAVSPGGGLTVISTLDGGVQSASGTSSIVTTPVLGADGAIYTLSDDGRLTAWTPNATAQWFFAGGVASGSQASLTLDCRRSADGAPIARPGVLYAAALDGKLYAFIVDSHGLDTGPGAWPKYGHDPRNTNNSATDLSQFACP